MSMLVAATTLAPRIPHLRRMNRVFSRPPPTVSLPNNFFVLCMYRYNLKSKCYLKSHLDSYLPKYIVILVYRGKEVVILSHIRPCSRVQVGR